MNTQKKAPAATEASDLTKLDSSNINLCSGFGQYHSTKNKRDPKDYVGITLKQLTDMLATPPSTAKEQGQWAIFSNLASRDVIEQRKSGEFYALWADIDDPDGQTLANMFSLACGAVEADLLAYTSRSATEDKQKCRFIVPLAHPVNGNDFEIMQKILNDKLEAAGIMPDRKTETANQICYLPNKGEFYDWHENPFSGLLSVDSWGDEFHAELEALEAAERERKQRLEQSKRNAIERMQSGVKSPIEAFNAAYSAVDLLPGCGGKVKGNRAVSPLSESGNAQMAIQENGKLLSHHGSDMEAGIGKLTKSGKARLIDAWDLFKYFEHGNDETAALEAAGAMFKDENGVSITKQNQREYMANHNASPEAIAAVKAMFDKAEDEPDEPSEQLEEPSPADVDIDNPPGLAGDICRLMQLKARRLRPELYPLAALHLMALMGRKRKSVYTSKLNLITLGIAETAAGKETAQNVIKKLANDMYASRYIHGNAGSFKDLIENLIEGEGTSLYIVDEIHSFLDSMKSNKANTYETKMEAEILVMSSTELYTFRGMEKRQILKVKSKDVSDLESKLDKLGDNDSEEKRKLERALEKTKLVIEYLKNGWPDPFFSIMGHSVPDRLDSFASLENIASGFIGRTIIRRCPERREKLRRTQLNSVEVASLHGAISWGFEQMQASHGVVDVTPEAEAYLNACVDWYDDDDQLNHSIVGGVYARAPEQLFKVASILGLDGGTITLEHAKYAHALVKNSVDDVKYLILKSYAERAEAGEVEIMAAAKQTVLRNCKGQGLAPSKLREKVSKPKSWQQLQQANQKRDYFQELIERLLQSGELELIENGRRQRYLSRSVV